MSDPLPVGAESIPDVTVRYWGRARTAAGVESESVEATNLAELLDEIDRRHRDRPQFRDVVGCCAVMIGDLPVGSREPAEVRLNHGDEIEILPPFAGGGQ